MGSQKVPGMVALHCNGHAITPTQSPSKLAPPPHTHTHTHTHTHRGSMDPATVGRTDGRHLWNLPKFGRRIPFDVLHGCETSPKCHSERDPESTVVG
jgi:hypothetical protein